MTRSKFSIKSALVGWRHWAVHGLALLDRKPACCAVLLRRVRLPGGVRARYDLWLYLAGFTPMTMATCRMAAMGHGP